MPKQNIEECELTEGGVFFSCIGLVWCLSDPDANDCWPPKVRKNFGLSQSSKGEVIRSRQRIWKRNSVSQLSLKGFCVANRHGANICHCFNQQQRIFTKRKNVLMDLLWIVCLEQFFNVIKDRKPGSINRWTEASSAWALRDEMGSHKAGLGNTVSPLLKVPVFHIARKRKGIVHKEPGQRAPKWPWSMRQYFRCHRCGRQMSPARTAWKPVAWRWMQSSWSVLALSMPSNSTLSRTKNLNAIAEFPNNSILISRKRWYSNHCSKWENSERHRKCNCAK